jgi:DNA invertase Pin-like site-specific DNA recombinase
MDTLDNTAYDDLVAWFHRVRRYAVKPPPSDTAIAYSYLRFSSPAQADGDSVRRQTALRDDWLRRHPGVRLDTTLTLIDAGVSGFRGEHRKNGKHALASFLDLVRRGRVPAGSFLIAENLDRLSREHPLEVMGLVGELTRAGVRVVQLSPETVFTADMDEGTLCMLLLGSVRGHGESKRKSSLLGEAWSEKKRKARSDKVPHGRMCPAWLELVGGRYRVKEDAARAVRMIFRWCAEGTGAFGILAKLATAGVAPFGRSGQWERSYVRKVLTNPAVLGIYQPCKGHTRRVYEGDPVPGYYPAVVDEPLWYAAQAAMKARTRKTGRPATAAVNPFSGLVYSALDGSKLQVCGTNGYKYLVSAAALMKRRGCEWRTFPLKPFVDGVLSRLRELGAADLFADPGGAKVAELEGRLADVEKRLAVALARFEADPESPTWADRVDRYDRDKRALVAGLAEARQAASNPLSGAWAEAVALMAREDHVRLRAALLATVEGIWCLFVPRGSYRLAAVSVRFKDGQRRDYLLAYRSAAHGRTGGWSVRSFKDAKVSDSLDMTKPAHVAKLTRFLEGVELPSDRPA